MRFAFVSSPPRRGWWVQVLPGFWGCCSPWASQPLCQQGKCQHSTFHYFGDYTCNQTLLSTKCFINGASSDLKCPFKKLPQSNFIRLPKSLSEKKCVFCLWFSTRLGGSHQFQMNGEMCLGCLRFPSGKFFRLFDHIFKPEWLRFRHAKSVKIRTSAFLVQKNSTKNA